MVCVCARLCVWSLQVARARKAEETASERAKTLELEVNALKAAAAGEVQTDSAEQRWQASLVKLGTAEQRAVTAQRDLESQQSAQDALMAEIEELSQAYEEAQTKTDELRATLALKEEALGNAKKERLRADQTATMLRSEHEKMTDKCTKLSAQSDVLGKLKASFESQLRAASAASTKKEEEVRAYEGILATQKASLKEAQQHAQQASLTLRQAQEAEQRAKEREEKAAALAAAEAASVKRLAAERDTLSRKLASKELSSGGASKGGGGASDEVLEHLRRKLKCSLCLINDKDAIINKCNHAFCRECLQKRLDVRNRKCPACAVQFDYQSVKDLFLTN